MNQDKHEVHTLNDLIEVTIDSKLGYAEAAKEANQSEFKMLFEQRAAERLRIASRLQEEVRRLGGTPVDDGSIGASVHRVFVDLKATLSKGDRAVVNEVERGEDHIKAKFKDALDDGDLTGTTGQLIQECYQMVLDAHDQMSSIKHSLEH